MRPKKVFGGGWWVGLAVSGSNRAKVRTKIEPETANRTNLKPANHLNELYAKLVQNGNER